MFSAKYIIYGCIVLSALPFVVSIKCWNCRSNNDPKCADPFDNSTVPITDCSHEAGLPHLPGVRPTMCRKIRQKVNGELVIIRGCSWKQSEDNSTCPMGTTGGNEINYFCETCDYDGCNGASTIGKAIAAILAPFALLLLLK